MTEHYKSDHCPVCGHDSFETVDTQIRGRGAGKTMAIQECHQCGTLWGDVREFWGVCEP